MWPWAHLAVGYLLYTAFVRATGRTPTGPTVIALAVGTQFPDLVDKPLAWTVAVLPTGRSLAHSLVTIAAILLVLSAATRGSRASYRPLVGAFGLGAVSHSLSDYLPVALAGDPGAWRFLFWPVVPFRPVDLVETSSFLEQFASLSPTPRTTAGLALFTLATAAWVTDGTPGVETLRAVGARARRAR
jgi:membrane-bound metal-dependent hydrolase YbcI (DUF457 family)